MKIKENWKLIAEHLGDNFMYLNGAIYSSMILSFPIELNAVEDDEKYIIWIVQDTILDNERHKDILRNLMGWFFKMLLRKLRLKQIGRKLFDPSKS